MPEISDVFYLKGQFLVYSTNFYLCWYNSGEGENTL